MLSITIPVMAQQDCFDAIPVCSANFNQTNSYSGVGSVAEIAAGTTCLGNGEVNSVWYSFTVTQSGNLKFQLNPNNPTDDYDFALYEMTGDSCSGIVLGLNLPVSCNYSSTTGSTGLDWPGNGNSSGSGDSNQNTPLSVQVGETYMLMVSNFTSSQSGYSLTFGGNASVVDQQASQMIDVDLNGFCNPNRVFVELDEEVECSSISNGVWEFSISGPSPLTISSVAGMGCSDGRTKKLRLNFTTKIQSAGIYTITLQNGSDGNTLVDVCGNAMSVGESITFEVENVGPNVNIINVVDANCGQDNGSAQAQVTSGTVPYTYSWYNTPPAQTTAVASALPPGTYNVVVSDANGCLERGVANIDNNSPINLSSSNIIGISCNGANDGSAQITVNGGTAPYSYSWSGGGTTVNGNNLDGGVQIVEVEDATGCIEIIELNIPEPTPILIGLNATNPDCGVANGQVAANVTGGTGAYSYQWNDPANQTTPIANGLIASVYQLTTTDQNGCSSTGQIILSDNFAPNASISESVPDCHQGTGSATALATSGVAPFAYSWNTVPAQVGAVATGLSEGDYFVTITDAAGCVQIINVKIDEVEEPMATTVVTDATCGDGDGIADITVTGGVGPYSFNWNQHPTYSSEYADDLWPEDYTVAIVDAIGCTTEATFTVGEEDPFSSVSANPECQGNVVQFSHSTTAMPQTFIWDFGDGTNSTLSDPDHIYTEAGTYNVRLQLLGGCKDDVVSSTIEVYPLPQPSFSVSPEVVTTRTGADFIYTGTPGIQFQWDLGNGTESTIQNPSGTYPDEGEYPITLTVVDEHNCVSTLNEMLTVELAPTLFFPNAFNPNGSLANRNYRINGIGLTDIEFIITDRWGTEVYYSSSPDQIMYEGWDGNIGGNQAPQGVYAYFVKATFFEGSEFEDSGTITLLR